MLILNILNYTAMSIGYVVLFLIMLFALWVISENYKDRKKRKAFDQQKINKDRSDNIVKPTNPNTSQKIEVKQELSENLQTNSNNLNQDNKNDDLLKKTDEKLVDESGRVKMVG